MATEVKQRNNRVFVLVGGVVAVAAFLGVVLISRGSNSTTGGGAGPTTQVVVAKVDLAQGAQLTQDVLTTVALPADKAPGNAYLDATPVLGKYLSVGVTANTPITPGLIIADKAAAQTAALSAQPLDISPNFVALAIPGGSDLINVGCNIHPEDHIDIMIDPGNKSVRYSFQDLRVLAVGDYGGSAACPPPTLIVELPRAQAEQLAFLTTPGMGPGVVVKYVLRPHAEYGKKGVWPGNYEGDGDSGVPQKSEQPANAGLLNQLFPAR